MNIDEQIKNTEDQLKILLEEMLNTPQAREYFSRIQVENEAI